jgi:hypothetical protein
MGKVKQWSVEKKDAIETMLINMWASLGMDIPNNYEDIVQYCYEDVCETADPENWHSGDVAIAFRRWIEDQATENVRPEPMSEPKSAPDVSVGQPIYRMEELRYLLEGLDDHDQICIEACDEHGDVEDLYPMYVDVIENVRLTDGTIVREVRFCQLPNSEPDTRDKQPLVDMVIEELKGDIADGDVTVLDELLMKLPWEILKGSLPEDKWKLVDNLHLTDQSIWGEIRNDFEDDEGIVHIDAFLTDDDMEEGKVIAKVNSKTKEVEYIDERAKTDPYAQEMIRELL